MSPERWAQIEAIFHHAAECHPEQRSIVLDDSCSGDEELRREVEALLGSDGAAGAYMQAAVDAHLDDFAFPLKGQTVGHYRVVEGLDGGGMGLVYRAEDIRLGRPVALKFLPEDLTRDPGALSRFEREARAASALQHASICPVYEYGEHDGIPFIVMPLLDGQTLRETIADANRHHFLIAPEDLLAWAIEIAEGLEAAHRQGFIHRDIKPDNIFITTQRHAMILDFGLAKAASTDVAAERALDSASRLMRGECILNPLLSRAGTAIGTAGYMSPEQMRGEKLDARSDLFSFGLVLYEMATGQRAFRGNSIGNETQHSQPAPAHEIKARIPAGLEKVISKAMSTAADLRYQSAAEMRADLENVKRRMAPANLRSRRIQIVPASALLLCAGAVFWNWSRRPQRPTPAPEFKLRQVTANSAENHLLNGSISPDGKTIAYTDLKGLHIKRLDSGEVRAISLQGQTVDTYNNDPSWFADSRSFVVNTIPAENTSEHAPMNATIWKVSVTSGEGHKLRENAFAWSVSPDGSRIAFAAHEGRFGPREVWLMDSEGENARELYATNEDSEITAVNWSPDGQRISYVLSSRGENVVYSRDLKGGAPIMTMSASDLNSTPGDYTLPDYRALYSREEPGAPEDTCNFWTAKLDPETLKPIEKLQRLTNWTGFCMDPTSSTRDGRKIAFLKWTNHRTIYLAELNAGGTGKSRHFTIDEVGNTPIDWTPDGKYMVFWSVRNGNVTLVKQRSDGEDEETILSVNGGFADPVISADGNWILWQSPDPGGAANGWQRLMRVSIHGGVAQPVDRVRSGTQLQCARNPSTTCILIERADDEKHAVVTEFDPIHGRGAELAHFDMEAADKLNGTLSYDGCCLALMPGLAAPIRILSLHGRPERLVPTKGLNAKQFIRWTARGNGFYVTNGIKGGMDLFLLNWTGHSKKLWHNDGDFAPIAIESPDMRHLAIQGSSQEANLWLMENP